MEMLRRVPVGRIVAAADMAAGPENLQMQPDVARLQALFATKSTRRDVTDFSDVLAGHRRGSSIGVLRVYVPCKLDSRDRLVAEKSMQRGNHLRALADRPAHAFDRTGPHVADRKHARHRGFQRRHGLPALSAGQDEAGAIKVHAAVREPACRGIGTDEQNTLRISPAASMPVRRLRQRTRSSPLSVPSSPTISCESSVRYSASP